MESRVEKAVELFRSGYNCSQSVFAAYADLFGMDTEQALRVSAAFGGGLAGMRHVCGSVNAMAMIAGLHNGPVTPADREGKKANFDTVKMLTGEFSARNGSILCRQLRGMEPGLAGGLTPKPCVEYVRTCAMLIEKYLIESENNS